MRFHCRITGFNDNGVYVLIPGKYAFEITSTIK